MSPHAGLGFINILATLCDLHLYTSRLHWRLETSLNSHLTDSHWILFFRPKIIATSIVVVLRFEMKNDLWTKRSPVRLTVSLLRDHPFKTSANFHDFWPLPPLPLAFQQNAYEVDFFILMYCNLLTIGTWGHPSPLRHADVLNEWSHSLH